MKRIAATFAAVLLAVAAVAAPPFYTSGAGITVGPVNTTITFTDNHSGGPATAFRARAILVRNVGSKTCFIDFADGVATVTDSPLPAGGSLSWPTLTGYTPETGVAAIGVICTGTAAYKTATLTDANKPVNTDTLVITDGVTPKTYTFVTTVAVEGDIKVDTADAMGAALANALNGTAGAGNAIGGAYLVAAANPLVSAEFDATGAGTATLTVTARVKGTAGASIAGNETSIGAAWTPSFTLNTGGGTQDNTTFYVEATR